MSHVNEGMYCWRSKKRTHRAHIIGPRGKTFCQAENGGCRFDMVEAEPPQGRKICINCLTLMGAKPERGRTIGQFSTEDSTWFHVSLKEGQVVVKKRSRVKPTERLSFAACDGEYVVGLLNAAIAVAGAEEGRANDVLSFAENTAKSTGRDEKGPQDIPPWEG